MVFATIASKGIDLFHWAEVGEEIMRLFLGFLAVGLVASACSNKEPVTTMAVVGPSPTIECPLGGEFRVAKSFSQWIITYRGRPAVKIDAASLDNMYGGAAGNAQRNTDSSSCANNFVGKELFGFVVGRLHDLVTIFGIDTPQGTPVGLSRLDFFEHDDRMDVSVIGLNQVVLTFGNKRDLHARLCWYSNNVRKYWWRNLDSRGDYSACYTDEWRWLSDNETHTYYKLP